MSTDLVLCIVVPFLLVVVVMALINRQGQKAIQDAHATYQEALHMLKAAPASADLWQRALSLGRVYSNLTRNKKGVTVYDEMALMNDLNAASAGAPAAATSAPMRHIASVEERVKLLNKLRTNGLITDREFESRRRKILDDL
jgi:hypothetical protein